MEKTDIFNMSEKTKEFRTWARQHHMALKLPGLTNNKVEGGEDEEDTEGSDVEKMVDFSSMLLCPLCHEVYTHPVKLNCNHSMCYGCARSQVLSGDGESSGGDDLSVSTVDTVSASSFDVTSTTIPDEVVIKTNDLKSFKVAEIKSPPISRRTSVTPSKERGMKSGIRPPSVVSLRRENSGIHLGPNTSKSAKVKKVKKPEEARLKRRKQHEALKTNKIRFLFCPNCNTEVELPKSGFQGLVRNVGLERVVARFTNEAKTAVEVKCNYCNPPPKAATKSCLVCQMCYCNECFKDFHIWGTKRAMHQTAGPKTKLAKPKVLVCQDHHNKKVTLYCEDCRRPICAMCKLNAKKEHNGHSIIQMDRAHEKAKTRLDKNLSDLQGKRKVVIENIETAVENFTKLEENYNSARTKVNLRLTAMEYHVRRRKDQLMARVDERRKLNEAIIKQTVQKYHQILERSTILEFTEEAMKEQQSDFFLQNLPLIEDGLLKASKELYDINHENGYNDDVTEFDTNWAEEMAILQRFAQGEIPEEDMANLKLLLEEDRHNQAQHNHEMMGSQDELMNGTYHRSLDDVSFAGLLDGTLSGADSLIATDMESLMAPGNHQNRATIGSLTSSMEDLHILNGRDHSAASDSRKGIICSTPNVGGNEIHLGKIIEHFSNEANESQNLQKSCTISTQTEEIFLLEKVEPEKFQNANIVEDEGDATLSNSMLASTIIPKMDPASTAAEAASLKKPNSGMECNPKIHGDDVIVGQAYVQDRAVVQNDHELESGEYQYEQKTSVNNEQNRQARSVGQQESHLQHNRNAATEEKLTLQTQNNLEIGTGAASHQDNLVGLQFQPNMERQANVMDQQDPGRPTHFQEQRGFATQANFEGGDQLSDIYIRQNLAGNNRGFANRKDPSEVKAGELWELVQKQNCEVETLDSVVQVRTIDQNAQSSALIKGNRQFKIDGSYKWKIDMRSYGAQYVIVGVSDQLADHSNCSSSISSSNPPSPPLHGMQIEGLGIIGGEDGIDPQGFRGTCLLRVIGGEVKLCESWNDLYDPTFFHREDTIVSGIGIQDVTIEVQLDVNQQGEHNTVCLYDATAYPPGVKSSRRLIYSKSLRSNNHSEDDGVCFTPVIFCSGDVDFC